MIRTEAEYQEAFRRVADEKARIAAHRAHLEAMELSPEEIKRALDPLQSFHLQLAEEVESYERLRRGEANRAADRCVGIVQIGGCGNDFGLDALCACEQRLARLGQLGPAWRTFDDTGAEPLLQRFDPTRHRGLVEAEVTTGLVESPGARHRQEQS